MEHITESSSPAVPGDETLTDLLNALRRATRQSDSESDPEQYVAPFLKAVTDHVATLIERHREAVDQKEADKEALTLDQLLNDVEDLPSRSKELRSARSAIHAHVAQAIESAVRKEHQFRDDVFMLAHRIRRNKNLDLVAHIIRLCEERGAKAQILRDTTPPEWVGR